MVHFPSVTLIATLESIIRKCLADRLSHMDSIRQITLVLRFEPIQVDFQVHPTKRKLYSFNQMAQLQLARCDVVRCTFGASAEGECRARENLRRTRNGTIKNKLK